VLLDRLVDLLDAEVTHVLHARDLGLHDDDAQVHVAGLDHFGLLALGPLRVDLGEVLDRRAALVRHVGGLGLDLRGSLGERLAHRLAGLGLLAQRLGGRLGLGALGLGETLEVAAHAEVVLALVTHLGDLGGGQLGELGEHRLAALEPVVAVANVLAGFFHLLDVAALGELLHLVEERLLELLHHRLARFDELLVLLVHVLAGVLHLLGVARLARRLDLLDLLFGIALLGRLRRALLDLVAVVLGEALLHRLAILLVELALFLGLLFLFLALLDVFGLVGNETELVARGALLLLVVVLGAEVAAARCEEAEGDETE